MSSKKASRKPARAPQRPAAAAPAVAKAITSARELAQAVGLTHTAVNKWLKDERWPFPRVGPWPVSLLPRIRDWQRATLAEDPAAGEGEGDAVANLGPEKKAKLALTVEKVKRSKLEREIRQGIYHRKDDCQRAILLKIHAVKQALATLHEQLPRDVSDQTRQWVRQRAEQICREFAAGHVSS